LKGLLLPRAEYFCTNLQHAEIRRTNNLERRMLLLERFVRVNQGLATRVIAQRSTPWNSPWASPWNSGGEYYAPIKAALELEKPRNRGNSYDAVLIETCKYEELTFVTDDRSARHVANVFGIEAISFEELLRLPYSGH
jgi:hypothetical protein